MNIITNFIMEKLINSQEYFFITNYPSVLSGTVVEASEICYIKVHIFWKPLTQNVLASHRLNHNKLSTQTVLWPEKSKSRPSLDPRPNNTQINMKPPSFPLISLPSSVFLSRFGSMWRSLALLLFVTVDSRSSDGAWVKNQQTEAMFGFHTPCLFVWHFCSFFCPSFHPNTYSKVPNYGINASSASVKDKRYILTLSTLYHDKSHEICVN